MEESLTDILSAEFKKVIPFLCSLVLVLFDFIAVYVPFSHYLRPDIATVCVYFWVLYRLDLFGIFSTALLGLVVDSLSAAPFGVHIFVLTIVYVLTITYGRYVNTKPFLISWMGFAFVSFAAFMLKWVLFSIYYHIFLNLWPVLMTYAVTVLIYPLIARFNIFIQNRYLVDSEVLNEQG